MTLAHARDALQVITHWRDRHPAALARQAPFQRRLQVHARGVRQEHTLESPLLLVLFVVQDSTHRKALNFALLASEDQFRVLNQGSAVYVVLATTHWSRRRVAKPAKKIIILRKAPAHVNSARKIGAHSQAQADAQGAPKAKKTAKARYALREQQWTTTLASARAVTRTKLH